MPEAVIVATARSPIGRAGKGSLRELRADDLTTQMVRAALAQVPALDPQEIDDLLLGCAEPSGEAGYNIARTVAILAGMDHLPGTTVNRFCSSSVQTLRMAFHAIRAGEGDAFLVAGVETVSHYLPPRPDDPEIENPAFDSARARSAARAADGAPLVGPTRCRAVARRLPRDGPDRRERRATRRHHPRRTGCLRSP